MEDKTSQLLFFICRAHITTSILFPPFVCNLINVIDYLKILHQNQYYLYLPTLLTLNHHSSNQAFQTCLLNPSLFNQSLFDTRCCILCMLTKTWCKLCFVYIYCVRSYIQLLSHKGLWVRKCIFHMMTFYWIIHRLWSF